MKTQSDRSPWIDLAVFGELWDNNAREYIREKYWVEAEGEAMKALDKFDAKEAREQLDHDMRQNEKWQNFWTFY